METKECGFSGFKMNGFLALFLHLVVLTAVIIFGFIISVPTLILSVCLCLIWFIMFAGYMELEPNEARAMVFFGKYKGTFKETGFFWVNPFLNKKKLSLRARNLDVEPIKVNDKIGNPILIGLVLVWKLKDTYKAMFEIDSQTRAASAPTAGNANQVSLGNAVANRMNAFENFVMIQSDAALRQVAGQYAYDDNEADKLIFCDKSYKATLKKMPFEFTAEIGFDSSCFIDYNEEEKTLYYIDKNNTENADEIYTFE